MQTSFLNNRNYVIPTGIFGGVFISLISRIGAAPAMLPAIISILFISVHEKRRYHPSQETLCQKKVFVERTILIASAPLIYKLCLSLFLSKQPSNLSRNWWIMCITPGMVAAAVRPAMTGEGKIQHKYRGFKLCPMMLFLTESAEELAKTLLSFMNMGFSVIPHLLLLYKCLTKNNQELAKLIEQLIKYLPIDWHNMNQNQLELTIVLNTLKFTIDQDNNESDNEEEQYVNNTLPLLKKCLQEGRCPPLISPKLLQALSQEQESFDLAKQYTKDFATTFLCILKSEQIGLLLKILKELKIPPDELRMKDLPKLQEITYEKFLSLNRFFNQDSYIAQIKHKFQALKDREQQRHLWQQYCPAIRHQMLFYYKSVLFLPQLNRNKKILLSDEELCTGAVDSELMSYLEQYTPEQLSLLITSGQINSLMLSTWLECNESVIAKTHPIWGALLANLVQDSKTPHYLRGQDFADHMITLLKRKQVQPKQLTQVWECSPYLFISYPDIWEKTGVQAFQEFMEALEPKVTKETLYNIFNCLSHSFLQQLDQVFYTKLLGWDDSHISRFLENKKKGWRC